MGELIGAQAIKNVGQVKVWQCPQAQIPLGIWNHLFWYLVECLINLTSSTMLNFCILLYRR